MRKLWTALVLGAWAIALSATPNHKQTLLSYVGENPETGDQWVRPAIAPLVEVKVLAGKAMNNDRHNMMCAQEYKDVERLLPDGSTLRSHVIVFLCEDGTALEMTNVYFGDLK